MLSACLLLYLSTSLIFIFCTTVCGSFVQKIVIIFIRILLLLSFGNRAPLLYMLIFLLLISSPLSGLQFLLLYPNVGRREKNGNRFQLPMCEIPGFIPESRWCQFVCILSVHKPTSFNKFLVSLLFLTALYFTISHCPWGSLSLTEAHILALFLAYLTPWKAFSGSQEEGLEQETLQVWSTTL